jgi:hypothetical protein
MILFSYSNEDTKDEELKEVYSAGEEWSKPLSGPLALGATRDTR